MRLFLLTLVFILASDTAMAACGSRGGPAFRGPNGKCVGWKALERTCGTPPTTRCSYEGGGLGDTGQEKGSAFIAGMTNGASALLGNSATAQSFNVRIVKQDGIACISQTAIAQVASCVMATNQTPPDCKAQVDQALANQTCARLSKGKQAMIEAGSHSFDWVRFRVTGQPHALWAERKLVLD